MIRLSNKHDASHGLDSEQETMDPNESFVGAQSHPQDMVTGVSERNFLRKKTKRSRNQPS